MADATTTEIADALTGEKAIATVRADPGSVLLQPALWERFLAAIKADLAKEPCDLSTEKGRKAVASKAYKVTQTKTAVEKGGIALSKAITARRNHYVDQLDKLAVETRAPLTAWEADEKARAEKRQAIVARIQRLSKIEWSDTSDDVINRLCEVESTELDADLFGDELEQAQATLTQAVETMTAAIERLEKEEADKAELQRLQALEAQRLADEQAVRDRIAAAQTPPAPEPLPVIQSEESLDDGTPIISGKPFIGSAPSPVRQSSVSAPSNPQQVARDAMVEAVEGLDYFTIEDAMSALLDAIIAGDIPHVHFTA